MIAQRKKTFAISQNSEITILIPKDQAKQPVNQIKYYTDSVYSSLIYSPPFYSTPELLQQTPTTAVQEPEKCMVLKIDFKFLIQETKIHKKIFDNIGVLNIKGKESIIKRYGILITEEKGTIYVSLIE